MVTKTVRKTHKTGIRIENKAISGGRGKDSEAFQAFLQTLTAMDVGQSFLHDGIRSAHRIVLSACPVLLNRVFATKKEGDKVRVGRTK